MPRPSSLSASSLERLVRMLPSPQQPLHGRHAATLVMPDNLVCFCRRSATDLNRPQRGSEFVTSERPSVSAAHADETVAAASPIRNAIRIVLMVVSGCDSIFMISHKNMPWRIQRPTRNNDRARRQQSVRHTDLIRLQNARQHVIDSPKKSRTHRPKPQLSCGSARPAFARALPEPPSPHRR